MKFKFFTLLIISTMFAGAASLFVAQNPACAQNRGARFTFAPNVYRKESIAHGHVAHRAQPVHRVAHGHVPRSSAYLLGAPGIIQHTTNNNIPRAFTKSTTHVAMRTPHVSGSYKNSFGKPTGLTAGNAGQLKPAAKPVPKASKNVKAKVVSKKKVASRAHAKHIKHKRSVRKVVAKKPQGYGNQFYTPGGHTPKSTATRSVHAEVIPHR